MEAGEFAEPEDEGGGGDDEEPVGEAQGGDVEERTAKLHYEDLPGKDKGGYEQEASTTAEMECGAACGECACVEHVPELHEYEHGEEH